MRKLFGGFSLLAALLFTVSVAGADSEKNRGERTGERKTDRESGPLTDQEFVKKAAVGGLFEVESSRFALDQAKSEKVKKFAHHMIEDHTKANQELITLAGKKGWNVPPGVDEKHANMLAKLGKLKLGDFDSSYAKIQVEAHEKTVALFEKASKDAKDADLKAWAEKTLPTLKEHEKMARDLAKSVSGNPTEGSNQRRDDNKQ